VITGQRSSAGLRLPIALDRWAPPRCSARQSAARFGEPAGRRWSCQTYRMTEGPEGDVAAISAELTSCRKRGIERLDLRTHNQAPVPTPQLQRLAGEYLMATGRRVPGRIAQIKYLLRDAISAFADEDEAYAKLVKALLFGDSQHKVTKSAGELLDTARRQSEFGSSEARFRQARHAAFDSFAEFVPRFVASVQPGNAAEAITETVAEGASYGNDSALAPEVQRQVATIGYVDDGERFISLLSQAENVTIVGITNESLASMLRTALARKREAILRSDESWSSIRVVFLGEELLDWVNDERGYPDRDEARLLRRRLGVFGRRTVRVFLQGLPRHVSWHMYDSPNLPPLIGTLFEMPDGRRIVQLLFRRRLRNSSDHLYLELEDTRGHYFSAMFDEIVQSSIDDEKPTPVGSVIGQRFRVTGTRYRWSVLKDGSGAKGWLAMVLVITWRVRNGQAEPLLQLRTQLNATRELGRLTHPADHITQDDRAVRGMQFGLNDAIPLAAAQRRVQMETGPINTGELTPLTTGTYIHPDKEHLFFFVYSCRLPDGLEPGPQAEMSPVSVQELLSIRRNQVLRNALSLCNDPPAGRQVRADAFEIATHNLVLHDFADLAQELRAAAAARTADFGAIVAELGRLEEQTRRKWSGFEREAELYGLSGLHFVNST
jgi:NUDIX domain